MHAEAMLLIDDDQGERGELDALLEQRVRADRRCGAAPARDALERGCGAPCRSGGPSAAPRRPRAARTSAENFAHAARRAVRSAPSARPAAPISTARAAASAATRVLPQPTSPCTRRSIGFARCRSASISREHALLRARQAKRQRGEQAAPSSAPLPASGQPGSLWMRCAQQLERQLMRQQFLEREPPLRRVAPVEQQLDRRVRAAAGARSAALRAGRQARSASSAGGQPIRRVLGAGLLRAPRRPAGAAAPASPPRSADRSASGVRQAAAAARDRRGDIPGAPSPGPADRGAPRRSSAGACRAPGLALLSREVKESQREQARAVGDAAQQLAAAAKGDLGEQHLALDRGALPGAQFAHRHDAGAVLVAQRQQKQQILRGSTPSARSRSASASPTPAQRRRPASAARGVTARRCTPPRSAHRAAARRRRPRRAPDRARESIRP